MLFPQPAAFGLGLPMPRLLAWDCPL